MHIDFSQPITAYELIAIILAGLALVIPAIKWAYNKYLKKLEIDFIPSGSITLFFNKSGAYITVGGVYEAKNKPATVKNISAKVIREEDQSTLNLAWSVFPSPVFKAVSGKYESSFETAHPFKIEADTLTPAFVEFVQSGKNMNEVTNAIMAPVLTMTFGLLRQNNYDVLGLIKEIQNYREYHDAEIKLNDEFFWKAGNYHLELWTDYNDTYLKKDYRFSLSGDESMQLRSNITAILVEPAAQHFGMPQTLHTVQKKFDEIAY